MAKTSAGALPAAIDRKKLLIVLILLLAVYVIAPTLGNFRDSLVMLKHSDAGWVAVGLLATALSYCLAALTYCLLAKRRLRYLSTLLVQVASMFTNRLLPAGAGAIGVNYLYLRGRKHAPAAATSVVTVNNLLGLLGHACTLLLIVALVPGRLVPLHRPDQHQIKAGIGIAIVVITIAWLIALLSKRLRIKAFLLQTLGGIAAYRKSPGRLALALLSSILLTLCYAVTLLTASRAVGITLPLNELFIILTLGVAGATIVPTPGGVGGAEASLVGGFVLYGVDASPALAAALLYRLCTYWLPFIIGIAGFIVARRRRYV